MLLPSLKVMTASGPSKSLIASLKLLWSKFATKTPSCCKVSKYPQSFTAKQNKSGVMRSGRIAHGNLHRTSKPPRIFTGGTGGNVCTS